jgi:hypothetical protein
VTSSAGAASELRPADTPPIAAFIVEAYTWVSFAYTRGRGGWRPLSTGSDLGWRPIQTRRRPFLAWGDPSFEAAVGVTAYAVAGIVAREIMVIDIWTHADQYGYRRFLFTVCNTRPSIFLGTHWVSITP